MWVSTVRFRLVCRFPPSLLRETRRHQVCQHSRHRELRQRSVTYQLVLRRCVLLLGLGEILLVLVIVRLLGLDDLLLALGGVSGGRCSNVGHGRVNSVGELTARVARPEDLWRVARTEGGHGRNIGARRTTISQIEGPKFEALDRGAATLPEPLAPRATPAPSLTCRLLPLLDA
jgi:hypothetical protein